MTEFTGFPSPTRNFFSLPHEMINIIAEIKNLAELKVIIYVIRHTWGYQEYGITKAITVEEFMHGRRRTDGSRIDNGTGLLSDRSVKDGIKAAIEHGYLICDVDDTDKARIKKAYALKMQPDSGQVVSTPLFSWGVDTTPQAGSIYPSEVQNLPLGGAKSTPRSEKDTLERHLEKDTEEKQEGAFALPARAEFAVLNEKISDTAARLKAIRLQQEQEDELEKTVKRPAVRIDPEKTVRGASEPPGSSGGATHPQASSDAALPRERDVASESRAPGAKQAPLSLKDESPRPLSEKALRSRYEAHFWTLIEAIRQERGLHPPTYGKTWKALRDNQDGINAFYADGVSDEAIRAGYIAMLESSDAWLRNNFNVLAFFKRLQGLLDGKKTGGNSGRTGAQNEPPRPTRRNFTRERSERDMQMRGV